MKFILVFAYVFLTVGLAADSDDTCKDGVPVAESRELLQQQEVRSQIAFHEFQQKEGRTRRLYHFGEKKRDENAIKEATKSQHSQHPLSGSSENLITFGQDSQTDDRLMALRSWTLKGLANLPQKPLEARAAPGAWDHSCGDAKHPNKMSATQTESSKIPRHMHFVLFKERSSWINKTEPSQLISKESQVYSKLTGYEQLLIENMRYTMAKHGDMKSVHFMDDAACQHVTGKWSAEFLRIYNDEADLRFKSDICRLAAVYWEGGYHFDDDMLTYDPVSLKDDTDVSTVLGVTGKGMFQSFLAAAPCHPVLARNIEMMVDARANPMPAYLKAPLEAESYLLGPVTLKLAWDEKKPSHGQLLYESGSPEDIDRQPRLAQTYSCGYIVVDRNSSKVHYCSRM